MLDPPFAENIGKGRQKRTSHIYTLVLILTTMTAKTLATRIELATVKMPTITTALHDI